MKTRKEKMGLFVLLTVLIFTERSQAGQSRLELMADWATINPIIDIQLVFNFDQSSLLIKISQVVNFEGTVPAIQN